MSRVVKIDGAKYSWEVLGPKLPSPYPENWDPYRCQLTIYSEARAVVIVPWLFTKKLNMKQLAIQLQHPEKYPPHEATIWKTDVEKIVRRAIKEGWNPKKPEAAHEVHGISLSEYSSILDEQT